MTTIAHHDTVVIGGVDTHKDVHVGALLDNLGRLLATESFPTTRHGYRRLLQWLQSHGHVDSVGVDGCGSWGAGLACYLSARGMPIPKAGNGPVEALRQLRVARKRGDEGAHRCRQSDP